MKLECITTSGSKVIVDNTEAKCLFCEFMGRTRHYTSSHTDGIHRLECTSCGDSLQIAGIAESLKPHKHKRETLSLKKQIA